MHHNQNNCVPLFKRNRWQIIIIWHQTRFLLVRLLNQNRILFFFSSRQYAVVFPHSRFMLRTLKWTSPATRVERLVLSDTWLWPVVSRWSPRWPVVHQVTRRGAFGLLVFRGRTRNGRVDADSREYPLSTIIELQYWIICSTIFLVLQISDSRAKRSGCIAAAWSLKQNKWQTILYMNRISIFQSQLFYMLLRILVLHNYSINLVFRLLESLDVCHCFRVRKIFGFRAKLYRDFDRFDGGYTLLIISVLALILHNPTPQTMTQRSLASSQQQKELNMIARQSCIDYSSKTTQINYGVSNWIAT